MNLLLSLVVLFGLSGCSSEFDPTENLTIVSEGQGATNQELLFSPEPGSVWEDAYILDSFRHEEEVFYRVLARTSMLTGAEQWISHDETGVWLRGSSADGVLDVPILLVPNTVREGMAWEVDVKGTAYQFEVTATEPDVYTSKTIWTITRYKDGALIGERTYLEGFGPGRGTHLRRLDGRGTEPLEQPARTPIEITDDEVEFPIRSISWAENADGGQGRATAYVFQFRPENADGIYTDQTFEAQAEPGGFVEFIRPGQYYVPSNPSAYFADAGELRSTGELSGWTSAGTPVSTPIREVAVIEGEGEALRLGGGYHHRGEEFLQASPVPGESVPFVRIDQTGGLFHQAAPNLEESLVMPPRTFVGWSHGRGNLGSGFIGGSSLHYADGTHEQVYLVARQGGTVDEMVVEADGVRWRRLGRLELPGGYDLRVLVKRLDGSYEGLIWRDDEDAAQQHGSPTRQSYGSGKTFRVRFDGPQELSLPDTFTATPFSGDLLVCWTGEGEPVEGGWKLGGAEATTRPVGESCLLVIRDWSAMPVEEDPRRPGTFRYPVADFWRFDGELSHMGRILGRVNTNAFRNDPVRPYAPGVVLGGGLFSTPRDTAVGSPDDPSIYWWQPYQLFGGAVHQRVSHGAGYEQFVHSRSAEMFYYLERDEAMSTVYGRGAVGPLEELVSTSEVVEEVFGAIDGGLAYRLAGDVWVWRGSDGEEVRFTPGEDAGDPRVAGLISRDYHCYPRNVTDTSQPGGVSRGTQCQLATGESRFLAEQFTAGTPLGDPSQILFEKYDASAGSYQLLVANPMSGEVGPHPIQVPYTRNSAPYYNTAIGFLADGRPVWALNWVDGENVNQTELIAFGPESAERLVYDLPDRELLQQETVERLALEGWERFWIEEGIVMRIHRDERNNLEQNSPRAYEIYRSPILGTTPLTAEEPWPLTRVEGL